MIRNVARVCSINANESAFNPGAHISHAPTAVTTRHPQWALPIWPPDPKWDPLGVYEAIKPRRAAGGPPGTLCSHLVLFVYVYSSRQEAKIIGLIFMVFTVQVFYKKLKNVSCKYDRLNG